MPLDVDMLFTWGATASVYKKNTVIFNENELACFYYQILSGKVKMLNRNEDGKEFTQGYFYDGDCFGEPPLFLNAVYPASAVTVSDSKILKISKEKFFKILNDYPFLYEDFLMLMCKRLYTKSINLKSIVNLNTEERLKAFLVAQKQELDCNGESIMIPFTRQEIANLTGLRVETVIRVLAKMNKKGTIHIVDHKVYC